jgi:hypothetical protein
MLSVEILAAALGAAGVARGFGPIVGRLLRVRRNPTVTLTTTSPDGSVSTRKLNTEDAVQAEELVRVFLEDQVVSVEPETEEKQHGGQVGSE